MREWDLDDPCADRADREPGKREPANVEGSTLPPIGEVFVPLMWTSTLPDEFKFYAQ